MGNKDIYRQVGTGELPTRPPVKEMLKEVYRKEENRTQKERGLKSAKEGVDVPEDWGLNQGCS